jgi:Bacterial Ig-like domain (group 3)
MFKDNGKLITVPLSGGTATLTNTYSATGAHLVTAAYSGDNNNAPSTSATLKQYVETLPVVSKTVVTSSGSPSRIDQPVTFKASITSFFGKIPDGEIVTFFDGTTPIGTGSTVGGIATFTTSSLAVAAHAIKATYAGDATYATSSGTMQQVVTLYPSITKIASTPNPSTSGQPVTLTATVSSAAPGGITGQVTFRNGSTILGTASLSNGQATLITTALPQGTLTITANYKGDPLSLTSSGTATQIVH